MQLLLVFTREDPHIITLKNAALHCGYTIKCCHNIEETHEAFKKVNYDLVFIDCRRSTSISSASASSSSSASQQQQQLQHQQSSSNQYDYDNICRFIRKLFHYTVIVALTHNFDERDLPSVLPLLRTGFNKTFTETTNLNRCINELMTLEYGEIQSVKRLQAAHVLFTALEFASDSIEIMNDQFKLLYANNSFEKLTGYTLNDISGQDFSMIHRNAEEFKATRHIVAQGHALEYDLDFVKSNGESVNHKSIIIPVTFQGETNKIQNYVTITNLPDTNKNVINMRATTTTTNNLSSNQLASANISNVNNKRSFSLPSKKSYDFERFANISLSLAEETSATATTASGGGGGSQSTTGKPSNKITVSLTTPALSSSSSPVAQLTNAQSVNAHLLTSTPSTTSTTLNDPQAGDSNFNVDELDDSEASRLANANNKSTSQQQVTKNEIAKSSPEFQQDLHSISNSMSQRKRSYDVRPTPFEGISLPPRRHSTTRFHPQTIEAPIRKVINIIAAANEKSTTEAVRLNLEKALDILKSTELYNPSLLENDKHTSDLVSGLMSNGMQKKIPIGNLLGITNRPLFTVSSRESQSYVKNLPPEIIEILENDKAWHFDIIALERLSNKRPLVTLGLKIMNRFDACDCLKIDEKILVNWLTLIESNYKPGNPYHNSTHASDVLHATSYFLSADKISDILDANDKVASLIAAAVHDLNHPGRTNAFLCNSNNDLAILYNDQAVLENHHASLAFQLTRQSDDTNIFKNLTRDEYRVLRSIIIDMVLATEMSKHFEHLNKFLNKFGSSDDEKPVIKSIEQLRQSDNKCLIKRILIKCADVSNPCRPLDVCKEWSRRIAAEYFEQTDEEKRSNLPVVMPTFDRQSCNIPKAQISFIEYFINDMFSAWDEFADIPEVMSFLQANTLYWRECAEAQQLQMLQQQAQQAQEQQQQDNNNIINEDNENERD